MKQYTLFTSTLFILLLIGNSLQGQTKYFEGYIVTTTGDILTGQIGIDNGFETPQEFWYKSNAKSEPLRYDISNANYVRVSDRIYENSTIQTIRPLPQNAIYDTIPALDFSNQQAFIQKVIGDEISLYRYIDSTGRVNYYLIQNEQIHLLINQTYIHQGDSGELETKLYSPFSEDLKLLLNDCEQIDLLLENIKYEEKSLVQLMSSYYECTKQIGDLYELKSNRIYPDKSKKPKKPIVDFSQFQIRVTPTLGYVQTKFDLDGDENRPAVNTEFSSSQKPTFGIMTEFKLKSLDFWSVAVSGLYASFQSTGESYREYDQSTSVRIENEIDISYIKLQLTPLLHLNIGDFSLSAGGGYSIGYGQEKVNLARQTTRLGNAQIVTDEKVYNEFQEKEKGWVGLFGLKFRNHGLYFRYETGDGFSADETINSTTERVYLTYGFSF